MALCRIAVDFAAHPPDCLEILTEAEVDGRTGVEMEALAAAAVGALTIYDMVKATCRGATIFDLELLEKSGGRSGHWRRGGRTVVPCRRPAARAK